MEDANLGTMNQFEANAQSFIVRLWCEHEDVTGHPQKWRGHIDHVPSGARRYFQELSAISQIIAEFVDEDANIDSLFEPMRPNNQE